MLKNSVLFGFIKHEGRWSQNETRRLIFVLHESAFTGNLFNAENDIDWIFVAKNVPGRTPDSCMRKYLLLVENGDIDQIENADITLKIQNNEFQRAFRKAFMNEQENEIYDEIIQRLNRNELVRTIDISSIARNIYNSGLSLAIKSIINEHLKARKWPFDINGKINILNFNEVVNERIQNAEENKEDFMRKYDIKKFVGSSSWVYDFMKRHHLSFRAAHYQRRGAIREEDIDQFLGKLADALVKYERKFILNVDETFINVFNDPIITISIKGQDTIKIEKEKYASKEGTTYLATLSMDPEVRLPLFIIAKGKTKNAEKKYEIPDCNDQLDHTINGWSTADSMISYLLWLSKQMDGHPLALLLDTYKAHMHPKVLQIAESLNIELIFIPPCGTGEFQPLDRFIFGFLKKKLRSESLEYDKDNYSERFRIIHSKVLSIWTEMTPELITKAWDIPDLNHYVYVNPDDENDQDFEE